MEAVERLKENQLAVTEAPVAVAPVIRPSLPEQPEQNQKLLEQVTDAAQEAGLAVNSSWMQRWFDGVKNVGLVDAANGSVYAFKTMSNKLANAVLEIIDPVQAAVTGAITTTVDVAHVASNIVANYDFVPEVPEEAIQEFEEELRRAREYDETEEVFRRGP